MRRNQALNRIYPYAVLFILIISLLSSCKENTPDNEFSFVFLGDIQETEASDDGYTVFKSLLEDAFNQDVKPEFLMLAGDIVDDGDDERQWQSFINAKENAVCDIDFYACVGNHDDTTLQQKYFDIKKHEHVKGDNSYYSFDYKSVHFTIMDSNLMGLPTVESVNWLKKDLKNTKARYKIVMFHHPAYPAVANPKDEIRAKTIRDTYIPIMEEYGVSLVLNGHQHVYMRTYPMKNEKISEDDGIIYLMGTASTKNYVSAGYEYAACSKDDTQVYSIITVKNDEISVQTKDINGNTVDSFSR